MGARRISNLSDSLLVQVWAPGPLSMYNFCYVPLKEFEIAVWQAVLQAKNYGKSYGPSRSEVVPVIRMDCRRSSRQPSAKEAQNQTIQHTSKVYTRHERDSSYTSANP